MASARTTSAHLIEPFNRLDRANEDAAGSPLRLRDEVEAMMDAVDEIDVGVAGRPKDDLGPRRQPGVAVSRLIVAAEVSFTLDDAASDGSSTDSMDDQSPEQVAGNLLGWVVVERPAKNATQARAPSRTPT